MQAVNSRGQAVSLLQDDSRPSHFASSKFAHEGRRTSTSRSEEAQHFSGGHTKERRSDKLQAVESGASWLASHPSHHHHHHPQRQQQEQEQRQQQLQNKHHHHLLSPPSDLPTRHSFSSSSTHSSSFPSLSASTIPNTTSTSATATSASTSPSSTSNSPSFAHTASHTATSTSSLRPHLPSPTSSSSSSLSSSHHLSTLSKVAALEPPVANSGLTPRRDRVPSLLASSTTLPYHQSSSSASKHQGARRPSLYHHSAYTIDSRKSSYSSSISHTDGSSCESPSEPYESPCFSPGVASSASTALPTPHLLRNESASTNSSASSRSVNTPSPMTPAYGLDPLEQSKQALGMPVAGVPSGLDPYGRHIPGNHPYFAGPQNPMGMSDPSVSFFPLQAGASPLGLDGGAGFAPMPSAGNIPIMPYATDLIQPSPQFQPGSTATNSASPPNAEQSSASSNGAAGQPTKARKKYPCPHAARFGCTDTFTTSGHAARHGKKHTGEKNIHCPTCHKAFTRKDNMKQHERTHRNNRDSVGSATDTSSKRGKAGHRPTNSVASVSATTAESMPNSALPAEMDVDGIAFGGRGPMDFGSMHGMQTHNGVFLEHDLDTGGPSPGNDELRYGAVPDMVMPPAKRPVGVKREISHGGNSQDGEGESPGLDALAMAASGFK